MVFQSTLSVRRATFDRRLQVLNKIFQSTLSVRRATRGLVPAVLRAGISIHALRKESDTRNSATGSSQARFQSTLFVRRATFAPSVLM